MGVILQFDGNDGSRRKQVISCDNSPVSQKTNHPPITVTIQAHQEQVSQSAIYVRNDGSGRTDWILVFEQQSTINIKYYFDGSLVQNENKTTDWHNSDNTLFAKVVMVSYSSNLWFITDYFNTIQNLSITNPSNIPVANNLADYKNYYQNGVVNYQWSSVPAISGKNGILSLTQILNINDGEPVEDVTNKGNLDFSKKTKVNTLVNSSYEPRHSLDETSATVNYEVPESDYQYTKLVYKKKKIPKSSSDGTVIDIDSEGSEIIITGLDEDTTYYFVIFTNKTKSNSYKHKSGSNPVISEPFREIVEVLKQTGEDTFISVYEWTGGWGKEAIVQIKSGILDATDTIAFTDTTSVNKATMVQTTESNIFIDSVESEIVTE